MLRMFLALLCILGTCVHSNEVFEYAGLVAAFTAPIVAVPLVVPELTSPEVWEMRAAARMSQSYLGASIVISMTYLSLLPGDRTRTMLQIHMYASTQGLMKTLQGLVEEKDFCYELMGQQTKSALRHLPAEIARMEKMLTDSIAEESLFPGKPMPAVDYKGAIRSLHGSLTSALLMWYYLETPSSASTKNGEIDDNSVWLNAFAHFKEQSYPILEAMIETLGHILGALDVDTVTEIDSAVPESLFELQTRTDQFLQSLDAKWCGELDNVLIGSTAAVDGMSQDVEARVQTYMTICTLLRHLRKLSGHVSSLAWRVGNIIEKESPCKSFIPEPTDMYRVKQAV